MVRKYDFLVIGSGIAGMSFALKVADKGSVAMICKTGLEEANTFFAQGGVASVTNLSVDNFEKHIEDTMIAGDWISDRAAVEKVVREAPGQIQELIKWGVEFDRNEAGEFDLHKEGQYRCRNSGEPDTGRQETSQHNHIQRSLCSRNHHPASFGHYRNPLYPRHKMLRGLYHE